MDGAGLPGAYQACDVLYSDLPWPKGQPVFDRRAGAATDHAALLARCDAIALGLDVPVIFIGGVSFLRRLHPHALVPTTLNSRPAVAACYRLKLPAGLPDAQAVLRLLARRYGRVGDPMAGYGRAGRIFAAAGGGFVLSDYNPRCIGYVAQHARGWFRQ